MGFFSSTLSNKILTLKLISEIWNKMNGVFCLFCSLSMYLQFPNDKDIIAIYIISKYTLLQDTWRYRYGQSKMKYLYYILHACIVYQVSLKCYHYSGKGQRKVWRYQRGNA